MKKRISAAVIALAVVSQQISPCISQAKFYASFEFDRSCINSELLDQDIVDYYTSTLSQLYNASSGLSERNNKGNIAVLIFKLNRLLGR